MRSQPFYHLRPNKNIDRFLFLQTLIGLSSEMPISKYQYTGFGSYLFDDFKLLHETLYISKMISLEKDIKEYQRAVFNKPYKCIKVKNIDSTEYILQLIIDDKDKNIFWLDYVTPSELGTQLSDFRMLLDKLNDGDVIRITLNANPGTLGNSDKPDELKETRFQRLKEIVPYEYFPPEASKEDMTHKKYPLLLLKILKAVTIQALVDSPPYSPNFMLPLFSSVYADGQQMLTFTGLVLSSHDKEGKIKEALENYPHNNFSWDTPCKIAVPELSIDEITKINKLLPYKKQGKQQLIKKFPFLFSENDLSVDSYLAYYKHYPHFHKISF